MLFMIGGTVDAVPYRTVSMCRFATLHHATRHTTIAPGSPWPVKITTRAFAADNASPIGVWQTIDDHTGQPKALVQIAQEADGTLSGKIVKGLATNDQPDRRCTACTDARKDQLMLGMTIIDGMKQDGDS